MKRLRRSILPAVMAAALALSGCVTTADEITFNLDAPLTGSEQIVVRYNDGTLEKSGPIPASTETVIVDTDENKEIVGAYITDGVVSWVPERSYSSVTVDTTGTLTSKPSAPPTSAQLLLPVTASTNYPDYTELKYDLKDENSAPVDDYVDVFVLSLDENAEFMDPDPYYDQSTPPTSMLGSASYTTDGQVKFLLSTLSTDITTLPLLIYSGESLLNGTDGNVVIWDKYLLNPPMPRATQAPA